MLWSIPTVAPRSFAKMLLFKLHMSLPVSLTILLIAPNPRIIMIGLKTLLRYMCVVPAPETRTAGPTKKFPLYLPLAQCLLLAISLLFLLRLTPTHPSIPLRRSPQTRVFSRADGLAGLFIPMFLKAVPSPVINPLKTFLRMNMWELV